MQPDEASCVATLDSRIDGSISSGISQGALKFDSGAAKRCLAGLRAGWASCDAELNVLTTAADCAATVTGTAATGAFCVADIDCVAADWCMTGGNGVGTCQPRAKAGAGCLGGQCLLGSVCIGGKCGGYAQPNDACETHGQCTSGSCQEPCAIMGVDPQGNPIVDNVFCQLGCTARGECNIACTTDPSGKCPSAAERCTPLRKARDVICAATPTM